MANWSGTLKEAIEEIDARFRSGNSIPVERATIPAQEWSAAKAYIAELEQQLELRKAAIEAQFRLMEQVKTLTKSNERLRQKIDRLR